MANHQASVPRSSGSRRLEFNGQSYVAVAVAFIVLEVICVALRFWARKIGKISWGLDDSLIIAAAILCLALIGCSLGEISALRFSFECYSKKRSYQRSHNSSQNR